MLSISANLHCRRHHLHRPHQDQRLSHRRGTVLFLKTSAVLQPKQPYTYQQTNHKSISTGNHENSKGEAKVTPDTNPRLPSSKIAFLSSKNFTALSRMVVWFIIDETLTLADLNRKTWKTWVTVWADSNQLFESAKPGKVHCSKMVCQDIEERPKVRRKSLVHFRLLTFLWGLLHHCWQLLQVFSDAAWINKVGPKPIVS